MARTRQASKHWYWEFRTNVPSETGDAGKFNWRCDVKLKFQCLALLGALTFAVTLALVPVVAQGGGGGGVAKSLATLPTKAAPWTGKTPWGDPDLQGNWDST